MSTPKGAQDGLAGASAANGAFIPFLLTTMYLLVRVILFKNKITSLSKISTFLRFSLSALFSSADPTAKNNWQRFVRGLHITSQDWQLLVLGSSSIPRIY